MNELHWRFVTQGPDSYPDGHRALALDVGARSDLPGVVYFTHHGAVQGTDPSFGTSSTRLLFDALQRLGNPLSAWRKHPQPITIFCHIDPDLDCFASSYLAWAYLVGWTVEGRSLWDDRRFREFARALATTADLVDAGRLLPGDAANPDSFVNFYTLFLFLDVYLKERSFGDPAARPRHLTTMIDGVQKLLPGCHLRWSVPWQPWMGVALPLMHGLYLFGSEEVERYLRPPSGGSSLHPIQSAVDEMRQRLEGDELRWLGELFADLVGRMASWRDHLLPYLKEGELFDVRVPEREEPVLGVFLELSPDVAGTVAKLFRGHVPDRPEAHLRPVMVTATVDEDNMAIISVPPSRGITLKGLGLALHWENVERGGLEETEPYRFYRKVGTEVQPDPLFKHSDPWYDGRDQGYTIVAAPRNPRFRQLGPDEILEVLKSDWYKLAEDPYESDEYRTWLSGEVIEPPRETER